MTLVSAIPALPVSDIDRAVAFYADRLGFHVIHSDPGCAVMACDAVRIHRYPRTPCAEPHLAGSASCRILSTHPGALYEQYVAAGVVHPDGVLASQEWGDDDFPILDLDENLIGFFAPATR